MSETTTFNGPSVMAEMIEYQDAAIVSRTLHKGGSGTVTLFAFDKGEALSEHTAPFEVLLQVTDGRAVVTVDGNATEVPAGSIIRLPANVPHAVRADVRFQMLLIMHSAD